MGIGKLSRKPDEMLRGGEGGKPYNELASYPGESSNTPSHFMLGNWDKLWQGELPGSITDVTFFTQFTSLLDFHEDYKLFTYW